MISPSSNEAGGSSTEDPGSVDGEGHREGSGGARTTRAAGEALGELRQQLRELFEYCSYYLSVKAEIARGSLRKRLVGAAVLILGLLAGVGAVVALTVLLTLFTLRGLAGGISALLESGPWAGELIVGGGMLALILGLGVYFCRRSMRASRSRLKKKYEERKQRQQAAFGHSVDERATEAQR